MSKKTEKSMRELQDRMALENREGDFNRARSITVGTTFGGTTEIGMRCNDGRFVWSVMQPVEVIELIHQLSANVGCHMQLVPRKDFASWRDWRVSEEERLHLNGHPPFPNDMAPHNQVGASLPPPVQQPGLNLTEEPNGETMAVEAPKQRRKSKRAAASS
jgi:hypothetical protein